MTSVPEGDISPAPRGAGGAGRRDQATLAAAACLALCLLNLGFQLVLHAGALDNRIVSARHPASADALEYARTAMAVAPGAESDAAPASFAQRFNAAFGDGWRMPGYPLFLAAFQGAAEPWRAARWAQVALTAPIGAAFFLTLLLPTAPRCGNGLRPFLPALAGGTLAALWPPLYHYSPALLAEAPALALMAWLPLALARRRAIAAGALIAALTYLKPNHLLLLGPVLLFFFLAGADDARRAPGARGAAMRARLRQPLLAAAAALALLAPWSAYVSQRQGAFVPLTLNAGYNLLLGTGRVPHGDPTALPYRVARTLGIQDPDATTKEDGDTALALSAGARAAAWSTAGRSLWAERPVALTLHGVAKALHAFGFSLRGARDALLALFTVAAVLAGCLLWRRRRHRAWVAFAAACGLAVALQAFIYLPNQRFKTVLFDPAALLVIALALPGSRPRNLLQGEA